MMAVGERRKAINYSDLLQAEKETLPSESPGREWWGRGGEETGGMGGRWREGGL